MANPPPGVPSYNPDAAVLAKLAQLEARIAALEARLVQMAQSGAIPTGGP